MVALPSSLGWLMSKLVVATLKKDYSIGSNDTSCSIVAYNTSPLNLSLISFLNLMDNCQWVTGTLMDSLALPDSSGGLSANQTQNFHLLNRPRRCLSFVLSSDSDVSHPDIFLVAIFSLFPFVSFRELSPFILPERHSFI